MRVAAVLILLLGAVPVVAQKTTPVPVPAQPTAVPTAAAPVAVPVRTFVLPTTFSQRMALAYAQSGYSYLGSAGPRLSPEDLNLRVALLQGQMRDPALARIPADMRKYGILSPGLEDAFYAPFSGAKAFYGITLQAYLNSKRPK